MRIDSFHQIEWQVIRNESDFKALEFCKNLNLVLNRLELSGKFLAKVVLINWKPFSSSFVVSPALKFEFQFEGQVINKVIFVRILCSDFRTRYLLEWYLIDWDLLVWDLKVRDLLSCNPFIILMSCRLIYLCHHLLYYCSVKRFFVKRILFNLLVVSVQIK